MNHKPLMMVAAVITVPLLSACSDSGDGLAASLTDIEGRSVAVLHEQNSAINEANKATNTRELIKDVTEYNLRNANNGFPPLPVPEEPGPTPPRPYTTNDLRQLMCKERADSDRTIADLGIVELNLDHYSDRDASATVRYRDDSGRELERNVTFIKEFGVWKSCSWTGDE